MGNLKIILITIFFGLVIFQISNRVNILIFMLIIVLRIITLVKKRKHIVALIFLSVVTTSCIFLINPRTRKIVDRLSNTEFVLNREANNSFETRLLVWDASLNVISKSPIFGVGASNAYGVLKDEYKLKRYVIPYRNRLNSHNQFLQIWIELGVVGLILIFGMCIELARANNNKLLNYILLFLFLGNFLFESFFNRYSGLIIFTFIYCSIITYNVYEEK